jgi:hypothetical protein
MFGSVPAAQAATDGSDIGAYPVAGTTFAGALASDFPVFTQLKPGSTATSFTSSNLVYKIEKTAGLNMDVIVSASATAVSLLASTNGTTGLLIQAGSSSGTVSGIIASSGISHLNFKAYTSSGQASYSPVTLKVTAWLDTQGAAKNDLVDSDELFTTFTVTLTNPTGVLTLTQPSALDTTVTVSSTVTGVNLANIKGTFFLGMSSSAAIYTGPASVLTTVPQSGSAIALNGGVISTSLTVVAISASQSVSAALRYSPTGAVANIYDGLLVGTAVSLGATTATLTAVEASVLVSDNSTASATPFNVRPNSTYTVRVHAATNSVSVSGAAVTVGLTGPALSVGVKSISINGGAATTSYPTALALTTGAGGFASFTLTTVGFAASDAIVVTPRAGNATATAATITTVAVVNSVVNDFNAYSTTPGTAVNLQYKVKDQWQVLSTATNQRILVTRGGTGFSYETTVSNVAVVAGAATFAFTPSPAAKTGSAVVSAVLQEFNAGLNSWVTVAGSGDVNIAVNVTSVTDGVSVSPVASYSASVSYFPSTVSWTTVTGTANNSGSTVEVSGDAAALVFRASAALPATTSGAITVRAAANGTFTYQVASLKAKTHTMTVKIGSAVTTSLLVVDGAAGDKGVAMTFDTSAIASGATATVTGTLVDMNGNAVYTTGSATLVVTYTGAGIPVGTMPTETDEDGKFSFNVLTGSTDKGTATVTAVYFKSGPSTLLADRLTAVQSITVGAAVVPPVVETQKVNVGSFKGFVALYAKGYEGQRMSAIVAGKWIVVESLDSGFERVVRFTGAGYNITVKIYIDGKQVGSDFMVLTK